MNNFIVAVPDGTAAEEVLSSIPGWGKIGSVGALVLINCHNRKLRSALLAIPGSYKIPPYWAGAPRFPSAVKPSSGIVGMSASVLSNVSSAGTVGDIISAIAGHDDWLIE